MSIVTHRTMCPECTDSGADNLVHYDDGSSYCYSCSKIHDKSDNPSKMSVKIPSNLISGGDYQDLEVRGISKETCRFFDYKVKKYTGYVGKEKLDEEWIHIANYYNKENEVTAQKIRASGKRMAIKGNFNDTTLFGQNKYTPNKNIFITVVEGEIDALTVAEVQGTKWPVVSIPNGAPSALKHIKKAHKYLSGFKYIVFAFDNDEAGQEAATECAASFEPGMARIAQWGMKDPNDMLLAGLGQQIKNDIFSAKSIMPDGIISLDEITKEEIKELSTDGAELPYPVLDDMIGGLKKKHLYTIAAREKSGKTSFVKEVALHLVNNKQKVGLLLLEEDSVKEALSLLAMKNEIPMWKFQESLKDETVVDKALDELQTFKDSGLYIYNHKGVIDIESVYNTMAYMIRGLGCDIIILDNISISVAGAGIDSNERKQIDNFVYKMVGLINNTNATILNVVHLVKNRKTRDGEDSDKVTRADVHGSGAFAKFSHCMIGLERDSETNAVKLKVLANRDKGTEGYADTLVYNTDTGRLTVTGF